MLGLWLARRLCQKTRAGDIRGQGHENGGTVTMTEPLFRLDSRQADVMANRRKARRHRTCVEAMVQSSHGEEAGAILADVSMFGCCVSADAAWLRLGCFVSIALAGNPGLQAIVRWTRDGSAGMEFLRPIPPEREEWHDLMD